MLSRSSFSEIQTVVTNMTGYDNKRLDGRNTKKTVQLHCCTYTWYTSTPLQQYQYVPKETVRHQASCEEVRRASQVSRVLLYSSNSNGVFVGRVSRAYVQHFMMPGTCYVPAAYDTRYVLYTACMSPTGSRGSQGHCFTMSYGG